MAGDGGPEQSLHMVPYEHRKVLAAERQICSRIAKIPNDHSISLEFFASANPLLASGDKRLALLALNSHKFPSLSGDVRPDGQSNETDIWKVRTPRTCIAAYSIRS